MPFVRFVNSQRLVELKSSFCFLFFPSAIFLRRGNGERWRGGWFESKYRGANIFSLFSNQFHSALWIYALVDCLSLNSREEFMLFVDNRWFVLKRGRTSFSPLWVTSTREIWDSPLGMREKERRGRFIYFGFPQRSNQMVISKLGGNIVLVLLLILIALGLLTLDRCIINYRKFSWTCYLIYPIEQGRFWRCIL